MGALWELVWLLRRALGEGVAREALREAIKREMTREADERMRRQFNQ